MLKNIFCAPPPSYPRYHHAAAVISAENTVW